MCEYFLKRGGDKMDDAMRHFCAEHYGDTVKEAAAKLGINGDAAQKQFDEYCEMVEKGEDIQSRGRPRC